MANSIDLADAFEQQRPRLRAVAYRMLGSLPEADDAVQDTWLRLSGTEPGEVDNLGGWLTTVVARVSLNKLRARRTRREDDLASIPDPVVTRPDAQPEDQAVLADSVGVALLIVLDSLTPAERLSFVLHDLFQLPFDEIAPLVDRTPDAARQLASRARRRVAGADLPATGGDATRRRVVVDAFFRAARAGDFQGLVSVLHPDVVLRTDFGGRRATAPTVFHGPGEVAKQAKLGALPNSELHPVLVNGLPGVVVTVRGRPFALLGFTVVGDAILAIDAIADPERVARVTAGVSGDWRS